MSFRDILTENIQSANFVANMYLSDLTDQELLIRSVPQANHLAWQLGHLISSNNGMLTALNAPSIPALPEGFEAAHKKDKANVNDADKFFSKAMYLDLLAKQKASALALIEQISEAELSKPAPESMRAYAPTVQSVLLLLGNHLGMHLGQFVVLRRSLNKPILI